MGNKCSGNTLIEGYGYDRKTIKTTYERREGREGREKRNYKSKDFLNKYEKSDLIRLLYTYLIFGVIAYTLIKVQLDPNSGYSHVLMMSIIYVILTLLVEILWLYFFSEKMRTEKGKKYSARNTIHEILNNILPISALIFGYIILIDGFRSGHSGNQTELVLRFVISIIFIISYGYLFYNLVNTLNNKKVKNALDKKIDDPSNKDNKATQYDYIIDLLYNLFQPISILIISVIIYYVIKMTYNIGGGPSPDPGPGPGPDIDIGPSPDLDLGPGPNPVIESPVDVPK